MPGSQVNCLLPAMSVGLNLNAGTLLFFSDHVHTSLSYWSSHTRHKFKDNIIKNFKVASAVIKSTIGPLLRASPMQLHMQVTHPYSWPCSHLHVYYIWSQPYFSSLIPAETFLLLVQLLPWWNPLPLPEEPCSISHLLSLQYFKIIKLLFTYTFRFCEYAQISPS